MQTTSTSPTSPDFCAVMPTCAAWLSACASGEPPPHGIRSSRFLAIAIERVGGSSTCANSPWKEMRQILSRDWYASASRLTAAPLAAFMRLRAIEPEASTTKITSEPALRAIFFARTSDASMNTLFFLSLSSLPAIARSRRLAWYGAAVRMVASTASLRTLPLGRMGLM
eukprot:1659595-Prymnesium_polylepis.1